MLPKPKHFAPKYAAHFKDQSIVDVYHYRTRYPDVLFDKLDDLIVDEPRTVLDVGCGTGDIARRLVDRVERVDAVDPSEGMIEKGKRSLNGDRPNLRWIQSRVEDASLDPPYALITAGQCIGWFDWNVIFDKFRDVLSPNGVLAILGRTGAWVSDEEREIIGRYSVNQDYVWSDVIADLEERGLFKTVGRANTGTVHWATIR